MILNCFVKKNQITNCRTVWDEFSCYAVGSCLIGSYLLFIPLTPQQPRLPGVIVQCAMLLKTEVLDKNALDCTAVPS